jgi:adenylate cyclase
VAEAEVAIERLATAPTHAGTPPHDILLLRLQALLAQANGDEDAYRDYRDRYRAMATEIGFEGHMAMAETMARRRSDRRRMPASWNRPHTRHQLDR